MRELELPMSRWSWPGRKVASGRVVAWPHPHPHEALTVPSANVTAGRSM
jgi:hypothetical protein